jgi:hypothetical protein
MTEHELSTSTQQIKTRPTTPPKLTKRIVILVIGWRRFQCSKVENQRELLTPLLAGVQFSPRLFVCEQIVITTQRVLKQTRRREFF